MQDNYTQIDNELAFAGIKELSASEVHGLVVGAICNHLKTGMTPDLMKLLDPSSDLASQHEDLTKLVYGLYRDCSEILFESKDGYELLLPDEEQTLAVRVEAIASWCKGFLLGLLYNNLFSIDQLPENGAEIVRDLMEISEAGSGFDDEQEEDWALSEIEEYVKVGSQLVFEFIYSERSSDVPKQQQ